MTWLKYSFLQIFSIISQKLFCWCTTKQTKTYEPLHNKTNKMACATSEDSDQPGGPPSLIRVFAVRKKKAWVLSYPLSASEDSDQTGQMPRLIWVFAGHTVILLVLSWAAQMSAHEKFTSACECAVQSVVVWHSKDGLGLKRLLMDFKDWSHRTGLSLCRTLQFFCKVYCASTHLSHLMTKPTKWHVCPAKTQISLGMRPVWSETSLSAWRKLGSLATHWAHSEDWSDWADAQTDLSLHWAHSHFVGFVMRRLIL